MTPTRLRRAGAAAASGILLALARPPFDLGPLALVALVPLFLAWRGRGPRGAAAYAFVSGAAYYAVLVSWSWYFGAVAIVPFVAALAAYWAAAGAVVGWFATRGMRAPWLIAAVWVLAEAVVARFPLGGFSWGEVGYALHDVVAARDVASVGGVALVSFLVVAGNALLADLVAEVRVRAPATALLRAGAGLVAVAVATGVIVAARPEPTAAGPFRVALLQGNDKNRDLTARGEERAVTSRAATSTSPAGSRIRSISSCSPSRRSTRIRAPIACSATNSPTSRFDTRRGCSPTRSPMLPTGEP